MNGCNTFDLTPVKFSNQLNLGFFTNPRRQEKNHFGWPISCNPMENRGIVAGITRLKFQSRATKNRINE
jgi:hypothetical protein